MKQQQQARASQTAQGQSRPAGYIAQRNTEGGLAPPQGMPAGSGNSGAALNNVMAGQQRMIRPMPARAQQQPQQRAPQVSYPSFLDAPPNLVCGNLQSA
jgi:hypothetical protein